MDINLRKLKYNIKCFFSKKELTEKDYCYVKKLLNSIKRIDYKYYLLNMAKLEINSGKYEDAKIYLDSLEDIDPLNISMYYNFFKLDVFNKNFEDAYIRLFKYYELSNYQYNVTLPLTMLEMLVDIRLSYPLFLKSDYSSNEIDKHIMVNLDDEEIKNKYNEVADYLYAKDFKNALNSLHVLNRLVKEKNFSIEVDTMIMIVNQLIMENDNNIIKNLYDGEFTNIENVSDDKFQVIIDELASKDAFLAKDLLMKYGYKIKNDDVLNILNNKVNEKIYYDELSDDLKDLYVKCYAEGNELLKSKKFEEAFNKFKEGFDNTGCNNFLYYMGKTLYKAGLYSEAFKYLNNYVIVGGTKLEKACLYLFHIATKFKKRKQCVKYYKIIELVRTELKRDFSISYSFKKMEEETDYAKIKASKALRNAFEVDEENNVFRLLLNDKDKGRM